MGLWTSIAGFLRCFCQIQAFNTTLVAATAVNQGFLLCRHWAREPGSGCPNPYHALMRLRLTREPCSSLFDNTVYRVWTRPGLTGTHVCVLNGVGFISSERWPRGSTYPHGSLIRHSSTTFEAVVHHPPRGGCLYGWQSMSAKTDMPSEPDVDWSSSMGATHHDVLRQELPVIR